MTKKESINTKVWIPIIVAIVGLIGTIGSAVINKRLSSNVSKNNAIPTELPKGFIRFDDPLGVFSIAVPSELVLIGRGGKENNASKICATYGININPLELSGDDEVFIVACASREAKPVYPSDLDAMNESLMWDMLHNNFTDRLIVLSNQKMSNGYYVKYQRIGDAYENHYYLLREFDLDTSGEVSIQIGKSNYARYDQVADTIISSFTWSSAKVLEYLDKP